MKFIDVFRKTFKIDHCPGDFGIEIETEVKSEKSYPTGFITPKVITLPSGHTKKYMEFPEFMSYWEGHYDNSLRNFGVEFVLKKPLGMKDFSKAMDQFGELSKKVDFIQDAVGTSIHVHLNVQSMTLVEIGNLLTLLTLFEDILIGYSGEQRRSNLFALPTRCAEVNNLYIRSMFKDLSKGNLRAVALNEDNVKYACINLGKMHKIGSIEIRCFRGSTDKKVILEWVEILNQIKTFAVTPRLTPEGVMREMKDRPLEFFSEIFGKYAKTLQEVEDFGRLMFPVDSAKNLFYAARIAGSCVWEDLNEAVMKASTVKVPDKISRYIARYATHLSPDQLAIDPYTGEVVMANEVSAILNLDYDGVFETGVQQSQSQSQVDVDQQMIQSAQSLHWTLSSNFIIEDDVED